MHPQVMGWFSKIFRNSNWKVSNGRYGTDALDQSTSSNSALEFEDKDCALALSVSEEEGRGEALIDREPQPQDNKLLARVVLANSNPEYLSELLSRNVYSTQYGYGYESDNFYQPIALPYSTSYGICAGCDSDIGNRRYLSCMNAVWHPECFRCRGCNHPISDYEFSVYGAYPYHKTCYKESHLPKCDVCRHIMPTNAAGLIEYRVHPFWSQKYCPRHEHDGTPRCCSCERMESWNTRHSSLSDSRNLCSECLDSAIMDTKECQPLYRDIQRFFKGLNMKVRQEVPLLLLDKPALYKAMGGEMHVHYHMPETRGLCLAEEHTVSNPRIGAASRVIGMRTRPYKITHHCKITAIVILYGLPRLLAGAVLAHEMMHAWLRLNGYENLSQDVEEGICQVIAGMWLESQVASTSDGDRASTSFEKKLGEFLRHQITTDSSPVYGDSFRAGHEAVLKLGLQRTLKEIRKTGSFPR